MNKGKTDDDRSRGVIGLTNRANRVTAAFSEVAPSFVKNGNALHSRLDPSPCNCN